tara:strand:+ start:398 stop:2350 length:1953 start_codon:yes stop_codon:yes gene_type:complete
MAEKYKSQVTNKWIGSSYKGTVRHIDARNTEMGQIVSALKNDLTPAMNKWGEKHIEKKKTEAGAKMDELYAQGWTTKEIEKAILNDEIPELSNQYATAVVDTHSGRFEAAETIRKINENIDSYDFKEGNQTLEEWYKQYLPDFNEASSQFTVGFSAVFNEWSAKAKIKDAENRAEWAHTVKINKAVNFLDTTIGADEIDEKYWETIKSLNTAMPIEGKEKAYFFDTNELNMEVALGHAKFLLAKATTTEELDKALKILTSDRGIGKGGNKLGSLLNAHPTEIGETLNAITNKRARLENKKRTDIEWNEKQDKKNIFKDFWSDFENNSKNVEEWREKLRAIDPTAVPSFNKLIDEKRMSNASGEVRQEFLIDVMEGTYDDIKDLAKAMNDLNIPKEDFAQAFSYFERAEKMKKEDKKHIWETNSTVKESKKEILDVVKEKVGGGGNSMFSTKGNDSVRRANYYLKAQILNFEEFNEDGSKRENPPSDAEWRKFMKDIGDYVHKTFRQEKDYEKLEDWAVAKAKQEEEIKKKEDEKKAMEQLETNITTSVASAIEQGIEFDIPVFSEEDKSWRKLESTEIKEFEEGKLYPKIVESVQTVLGNIEGIDFTNKETYLKIGQIFLNNEEQAKQFADMLGVTVEQLGEAMRRKSVE